MRKTTKSPGEKIVKDIKRGTRKHYSSEEKIRIVLDGLCGEDSMAELCRREGIGAVSAVTFVATIDTPDRFKRSKSVGAYIELTSRSYQSGDIDYGGRISKRGDRMLRTVLYEAANSPVVSREIRSGSAPQRLDDGFEKAHQP
jgi:transposase